MESIKQLRIWLLAILAVSLVFAGCQKDEPEPDPEEEEEIAPELTRKINTFIKEGMEDVYYWNKFLPSINIRYEFDSKAYFNKLLYTEDKWSFITEDVVALEESYQGIEESYGYSLAYGRFVDGAGVPTGEYFAIIEYVYPNTPASRAGFIRGDIITGIGGAPITANNYRDLTSTRSITVSKGIYTTSGIAPAGTVSMTAEKLQLDPVLVTKVIPHGGRTIGYLFYAQYIDKYNTSLDAAFQYFKDNSITDLVLDLRYNPGGNTSAAQYLCSSVAPLNAVNSQLPLVYFKWNDYYQNYFQSRNDQGNLQVTFTASAKVKLGLNKIHILTGSGTASASELTITGLEPYMNVTLVGDTTYGKYTASITIKPEDLYRDASSYSDFKNWGMQPIVIQYSNSLGVTNFKNGFAPKYLVGDKLLGAYPLGDINEPLLKKAIEDITGSPVASIKRAVTYPEFEVIDRGFSRMDQFKRNMPVDDVINKESFLDELSRRLKE